MCYHTLFYAHIFLILDMFISVMFKSIFFNITHCLLNRLFKHLVSLFICLCTYTQWKNNNDAVSNASELIKKGISYKTVNMILVSLLHVNLHCQQVCLQSQVSMQCNRAWFFLNTKLYLFLLRRWCKTICFK